MLEDMAKIPELKGKVITKRHLCQNLVVIYTNDSVIKVGSEQGETCKGIVTSRNVLNLSTVKLSSPNVNYYIHAYQP